MKNRVMAVMAAGVAIAGLVQAAPAQALGGNCSHALEKRVVDWNPDEYRARAWCSSLQGDSKAQGRLIRTGLDKYTSWFTRTNTSYYSGWYIWGTGSSVTIARV